jgi:hypothetical protein
MRRFAEPHCCWGSQGLIGNMASNSLSRSWAHALRPHGSASQGHWHAVHTGRFRRLCLFVSANGAKAWHFRFSWGGKRERVSFGSYPALSLKDARDLRDEARAMLAKGINSHSERKRKQHAIVLAGEHTFKAVYEQWLTHRRLSLEEGRQTSLAQIGRVFQKDVFPVLRHLSQLTTSSIAYRRVASFRPSSLPTFKRPHKLSVGALTLLCQAARAESAKSARISGYSSRTM